MEVSNLSEGKWQMKVSCLKDGIAHIYHTKEFCDVQFRLHKKYVFKAHKIVLVARSSEFAKLLLKPCGLHEIIIDEKTITKTGFEILLRFMYKDDLGTVDKQSIIEAYFAALYYRQRALQIRCEEKMKCWIITTDEVFMLLNVGSSIPILEEMCINYIRNNAADVLSSPSFTANTLNNLHIILKRGALKSVTPMERIKYVMRWAASQQKEPVNFSVVRKQLLDDNTPLLPMLEFEKLNLEELADVVSNYTDLLTPNEVTNFMKFHISKKSSLLPSWCSCDSVSSNLST